MFLCMGANDESAHARQMICRYGSKVRVCVVVISILSLSHLLTAHVTTRRLRCYLTCPYCHSNIVKPYLVPTHLIVVTMPLKSCIYFPATFRLFLPLSQLRIWNCYIGGLSPGTLRNLPTFLLCPPPSQS